ncbi:MAG TPA: hypothetical protein VGR93_12800 [Candidatus Acidoferrales bacterium]|nr:hypothetical protein [Candidatus Acidoferrales bacterium]
MRRLFFIVLILGAIIAVSIREYRLHHQSPSEEAFVGGRGATLWNSTAEIRAPVASLTYGQSVHVYQHYAQEALVSTPSGVRGWVSSASLMDPDLWRSAELLAESAKSMPIQAVGHTRARTNLHTRPGVDAPVILQAPADSPLVVLQHSMAATPPAGSGAGTAAVNSDDWWLVRADVKNAGSVTGWALDRLIALNLPDSLRGYQSSENINIVAWFEIDHVLDSSSQQYRQEYLVAGTRGRQTACDFTLLRVYTWSSARDRYETAFMDSHLCGKLPVEVTPAKSPVEDAYFSFDNIAANGIEKRRYRMRLTTVRRIDPNFNAARHASKGIHVRAERAHS